MQISKDRLDIARQIKSPNFDDRPSSEISIIVIHCISLPAGHFGSDFVENLFCNKLDEGSHGDFNDLAGLKVSSHLFIRRNGDVIQFVPFSKRAWHAGKSTFRGRDNCNDFSIGIELEGIENCAYTDTQYNRLRDICREMSSTFNISSDDIVGHSDIAPGRKSDPGERFDWQRLKEGLGK